MQQKKYTGSCYIAVVGSEIEYGECHESIYKIQRRKSDTAPIFIRATKGYEARQLHLNNWYENTKHPFILFLDSDMLFPENTLERLRSWKMPYLSGLYMRRRFAPVAPVWFDYAPPGQMPVKPFTGVPAPNTLYRLGASGWGCILLHRDVVTAVRKILKGEPEILEDDMDVMPYDLQKVMRAIKTLRKAITPGQAPPGDRIVKAVETLEQEIRPLRGLKDTVGSDIRFPFFARLAGFDLYGDSGVACKHMLNYPLSPDDYSSQAAAHVRDLSLEIVRQTEEEIGRIKKARAAL